MSNNRVPPRNRQDFKIAIVCALPLEASLVSSLFDAQWDTQKYGKEQVDTNAYSLGVFGSHDVVLVHMPNMGKVAAATSAAHLRVSFPGIQLALVVGICGGAPFGPSGELLLGDVVISEGLVQYDLGRRLPHTFVRKDTPGENLPRPRPEVRAALAKLQTSQGRYQLQNEMLKHLRLLRERPGLISCPGSIYDRLFHPEYLHRHHPASGCVICANTDGDDLCSLAIETSCEELGCSKLDPRPRPRLMQTSNECQPTVHFGLVATGDTVMRSGRDRDKIVARDKVIAFEMEGAGVWETFPAALVIKSVCDYADSHKNKMWQRYAAATAAAAAKAFMKRWNTTPLIPLEVPQSPNGGYVKYPRIRQLEPRELAIMKRLYTSPYRDRKERNPDRVAGTCEWFAQHRLFQDWKECPSSRLLWVSADPGCGKSVLIKHLVDSVLLTTATRTVCYFFFKDDFEDQKRIVSALCCILYQLFQQNPALLSEAITNQFEAGGEQFLASFNELWLILLTAAQDVHAGEVICILDAIDECEDHGRSQLTKELCKLYNTGSCLNFNLKFLVASRPFGKIRQSFQPLQIPGLPIIHLSGESDEEMKKISAEIDIYIKTKVQDIGARLILSESERDTLLKRLMRVPNRTYLWVYLMLDAVERDIDISREGILQATFRIPETVDEAYDRILSKSVNYQEAMKILHIVVAAERALTLTELGFALAIRQHHQSHTDIEMKSETRLRENIRDNCGLFVTIIQSRVYLLHQTAREFLVQRANPHSPGFTHQHLKWKSRLLPETSHMILAEICIWYLLFTDHDEEPHFNFSGTKTRSMAGRIFLDYSAKYWAQHFRQSRMKMNNSILQSILKICDTKSTRCEMWLRTYWKTTYTAFPKQFTTLMVVSYFGLSEVVKAVLYQMRSDVELNARDGTYSRTALSWAAGNGFTVVVKLLARGHSGWLRKINLLLFRNYLYLEINSVDYFGRTPLLYAIWNGNVTVVNTLIKAGAEVELKDDMGGTPLFYAMSYKRDFIAKLLLQNGAIPRSQSRLSSNFFFSAVEKGDVQVVQLFLDTGFDIESRNHVKKTPLSIAVEERQLNVVQLLLKQGANIEPKLIIQSLMLAAKDGHLDLIQILLDRGASVHSTDGCGRTPLLLAAENSHSDVVQFLLNQGATIEAVGEQRRTQLSYAAEYQHRKALEFFIDHGADIEATDITGKTPLFYAVMKMADENDFRRSAIHDRASNQSIMPIPQSSTSVEELSKKKGFLENQPDTQASSLKLLLTRGANPNAIDSYLRTPLHYAVESGDLSNIKLLLDNGANVHTIDVEGRTPLSCIINFESEYAIKLLLKRNAMFGYQTLTH